MLTPLYHSSTQFLFTHPSLHCLSTKEMTPLHHLLLFLLLPSAIAHTSKPVKATPSIFTPEDCSAARSSISSTTFPLMHINSHCSPFRNKKSTWLSTMLDSIKGDDHRYRAMTRGATRFTIQEDADVPLASNSGNYIINLGFGTPTQSFYTLVDTGSDISWIPCAACTDCTGDVFDPSNSPTFKYLSCSSDTCQGLGSSPDCGDYNCSITQQYGDGSEVKELLSTDSLAVGSQSMPDFIFGCAKARTGLITSTPGLVGFGRDSLSFLSQTADLFNETFSYCLPSNESTGCLELGESALSSPGLQFTSLLSNAANPSFYYVGLNGVSVGEDPRVSVPAIDESSGEGTIIDSGTTITRLVETAYSSMRDSFIRQLSNVSRAAEYSIFDACFNFPPGGVAEVPQITLHFDNNVDVPLQRINVLFPINEEGSVQCLAFAPPPGNSSVSVISILGSYQQHNFRIVYDIPGSRLGIVPEICG